MANSKASGRTAPAVNREHIYDSAGDGDLFRINDLAHGALGKSHSTAFNHLCVVRDDNDWLDDRGGKGIAQSKIKLEIPQKAEMDVYGTKQASAHPVAGIGISRSTYKDVDCFADRTSESYSNQNSFSSGHMPTWRNRLLDPEMAGDILSRQWPRVSLKASYTRKAPYVAPDENEKEDELQKINKDTGIKKRSLVILVGIILGIVIVAAAVIPVLLYIKSSDDESYTDYIKVNMSLSVNKSYVNDLNDISSSEYKQFTNEFCTEIDNVYHDGNQNNNIRGYYGCKTTNLSPGSIVVTFTIFYTITTTTIVKQDIQDALETYIEVNSYHIGQIEIINNTIQVHSVATVRYTSPPDIQETVKTDSLRGLTALNTLSNSRTSSVYDLSSTMEHSKEQSVYELLTSSTWSSYLDGDLTLVSTQPEETYFSNSGKVLLSSTIYLISYDYYSSFDKVDESATFNTFSTVIKSSATYSKPYSYVLSSETTHSELSSVQSTLIISVSVSEDTMHHSGDFTSRESTYLSSRESILQQTNEHELSTGGIMNSTGTYIVDTTSVSVNDTSRNATATNMPRQTQSTKTLLSTTAMHLTTVISNPLFFTKGKISVLSTTVAESITVDISEISQTSTSFIYTSFAVSTEHSDGETTSSHRMLTSDNEAFKSDIVTESSSNFFEKTDNLTNEITTNTNQMSTNHFLSYTTLGLSTQGDVNTKQVSLGVSTTTSESTTTLTHSTTNESTVTEFDQTLFSPEIYSTFSQSDQQTVTEYTTLRYFDKTTTDQTRGLKCDDPINTLYSHDRQIKCKIESDIQYSLITVSRGDDYAYSVFKNGTEFKDTDIRPDLNITIPSSDVIIITFYNMTCNTNKSFSVILMDEDFNIEADASVGFFVPLERLNMELSPDQVIDLVFGSKLYYRDGEEHICSGNVGIQHERIQIDFQYPGTDNFGEFPVGYSNITARKITDQNDCKTIEQIRFVVRFTEEMEGGRLRCYVPHRPGVEVISQSLTLVPRNICSCAKHEQQRGHPTNCNRFVECVKDTDGTMYPFGKACKSGQCRNSLNGTCSDDCSDGVCSLEVPKDFCIQPITTPSPTEFLSCNSSLVPLDSGSFDFECEVFNSSFKLINVTYRTSLYSQPKTIALVHHDDSVTNYDDNVTVSFSGNIVSFHFEDSDCEFDGYYGVIVFYDDSSVQRAEGRLVITYDPDKPQISLNADQISELGFFRQDRLHSCVSNAGNPPEELKVEFIYSNGTVQGIDIYGSVDNTRCGNTTVKFGINFVKEMEGGSVRCGYGNMSGNSTFDVKKVALIPRGICGCAAKPSQFIGSPSSCSVQVQCWFYQNTSYPYGVLCPVNQCRNSLTGSCSTNCSDAVCAESVPEDFCEPTFTTPSPSSYIKCNGTEVEMNSGPITMLCSIDNSTFTSINATFRSSLNVQPKVIAKFQQGGTFENLDNAITVNYIDNIVTFVFINATCTADGYFGISVNYDETTVIKAEAKIDILNVPGNLQLSLDPDQIIDLGFFRKDSLHTCEGDAGNPPRKLNVEFIYMNGTIQQVEVEATNRYIVKQSCNNYATVNFGINFLSEMAGGKVRCSIQESDGNDIQVEEPVALIPRNICACAAKNQSSVIGNPSSCRSFVACSYSNGVPYPYGKKCNDNTCWNTLQTKCQSNCSSAVCMEPVPENFCSTQQTEVTTQIHL